MDEALRARWIMLLRSLRPNDPPPPELYVEPRHGCASSVAADLLSDPAACRKFLLVGARGGGKSTELRAIARKLSGRSTTITIDLDASGINASSVSAFDLLYIAAVQILRRAPADLAKPLFEKLKKCYAGEEAPALGDLRTSWDGLAQFAEVSGKVAVAMGGASVAAGVDIQDAAQYAEAVLAFGGAGLSQIATGLRLRSERAGVVAETSPMGRALQDVCTEIVQACRSVSQLPICVVIDGLEKMNGEAGERFDQMFEQTRLLADTRWASVIAAPPCTLTETNSADGRGFTTVPVWGFGPDDYEQLKKLLEWRLQAAGLDPDRDVEPGQLERMAENSGGLPRHAVQIAYESVKRLMATGSPKILEQHVRAGIQVVAEQLGRGLNTEHLRILGIVQARNLLPGEKEAATLFADGRILAYPPTEESFLPRFEVHPLLVRDVQRFVRPEELLKQPAT